jgi:N-acetyl-anhydromuramyl-L-alanine amidase AmpD
MPANRSVKIGIHGRNDPDHTDKYPDSDYQMIKSARLEAFKGMSYTKLSAYQLIKAINPNIEITVRLDWAERVNAGGHPSPEEFAAKFVPVMNSLRPVCERFEVLNEPNHVDRIGGWGPTDGDARNFNDWFLRVYGLLKRECSWAQIGFPGLAVPEAEHRDLDWTRLCREAIERADWLGVHCYWQNFLPGHRNHLSDDWGLRFKKYRELFPWTRNKIMEITEGGNSNGQGGHSLPADVMTSEYLEYYRELFNYPYLNAVHPFIISSQDDRWNNELFVWVRKDGSHLPVVEAVGKMQRPPLVPPTVEVEEEPLRFPYFGGREVRGLFKRFFEAYGLDICGYPVTDEFEEAGRLSQYFQRVALEIYTQEDGEDSVRLKLVGQYFLESREQISALQQQVEQLQQGGGVVGPPQIKNISDELTKHPTKSYGTRPLDLITTIVINHSGGTGDPRDITPEAIADWQVKHQDRAGISYHYFIAADGTIFQTNKLETVTDHVGQLSPESVNVGFAGNFKDYIPTQEQLVSGGRLCAYLLQTLNLETGAIKGAQELITSASPGDQWLKGSKWKDKLLEQTRKAVVAPPPDVTALRAHIAELGAEVADLQTTISQQQAAINQRQAVIESQQEKIKQQQAEIERLKAGEPAVPISVSPPDIKDIAAQLAHHQTKRYDTRSVEAIRHLVMHHSGVAPETTAWDLADVYVNNFDWPGLGFHYFVTAEGVIQQTNALTTVSWHAKAGDAAGVGICLAGNFDDAVPSPTQIRATAHLCAYLLQEFGLGNGALKSHKDYADTDCPGEQWNGWGKWRQSLLAEIENVQKTGGKPSAPIGKTMEHYILFWQRPDDWAKSDWLGAQNYIGRFRPTTGFSIDDAVKARYVTIVGGPGGVSLETEQFLIQSGCIVERIEGADEAETKKIFDELAKKGQRFLRIVPG